ncbi:coproporphyrinogen III oxidase [Vibrio cholerae]|nr:coproporphyrinogen III oxidase [Vibrio cholerae]CSC96453.1 coproporphyrinogen III oxidase [Vibrio cholerae]
MGTAIRESFPLTPDCEITLEGRIHRFSDEMFENALEGGFNRFSFGVQSFNTQVRRRAKRLDDREVVMERIASLAATQQAPIVIDLLYGLPYQTAQVFEQDLQDFMQTGAQGIDLYQLVVGGSAPMLNLVEKGKLPPPATTPDKASLYQIGVEFMAKHHLRPLSVNHWTRDNRERSLYNSLAKTYAEVLPIGCGAGGNMGGYSLMQHRQLDTYLDAMKNGQPLVAMMARQHEYDPLFAALKAGFDAGVIAKQRLPKFYHHQTFDWLMPLFLRWQQIGLVEVEQDYLTLTTAGRFWSVSLAQACIQVLIHSYKYQQQRIA